MIVLEESHYADLYPLLDVITPLQINSSEASLKHLPSVKTVKSPIFEIGLVPTVSLQLHDYRVEYDMDEQDLAFASTLSCSLDLFELVMDRLEKEWFELVKDIPKAYRQDLISTDACGVCGDGEAENANAIVFCDGCNLAVHQDCYGIPFIPEGQWLCRKCMIGPEKPIKCLLCPVTTGAFKQTSDNKWAHLNCAFWIPECHIANMVFNEPIEGVDKIPKSRWKLNCYICKQKFGAPIQCFNKYCFTAFHPSCGVLSKLYMVMGDKKDYTTYTAFCDKHTPKEHLAKIDVAYHLQLTRKSFGNIRLPTNVIKDSDDEQPQRRADNARIIESDDDKRSDDNTKIAESDKKYEDQEFQISTTHPVIPDKIFHKIVSFVEEQGYRRKNGLIISICKYWALKRESRGGIPLLKRLHIEPWTAADPPVEDAQKKIKTYETLTLLRNNLKTVKDLFAMIKKREMAKLNMLQTDYELFQRIFNPLNPILHSALGHCREYRIFEHPVKDEDVPDYKNYIKKPMSFSAIRDKIENFEYNDFAEFKADMFLICQNCLIYNHPDTVYAKVATRLQNYFQSIVPALEFQISTAPIVNGVWKTEIVDEYISSFMAAYSSPTTSN